MNIVGIRLTLEKTIRTIDELPDEGCIWLAKTARPEII